MRRTVLIVVAATAFSAPTVASTAPIEWGQQDVEAAIEEAAACDGHVLVDVYATWCGPCHRLDEEVFVDPAVQEAAAGMVAVKVDAEVGNGPAVVDRYHVVGFPTVLVLDAQGVEIDRIFGFEPAAEFARILESIRFGPATWTEIFDEYRRAAITDSVVATAYDVGFHAAACGRYEMAAALLRGVVTADAGNDDGLAAASLLAVGKYIHLRGERDFDAAIGVFAELRRLYPDTPEADEALVQTGIAHARAGRPDSALAAFRFYMEVDEMDGARANTVAFSMFREGMDLDAATEIAQNGLAIDLTDHSLWDTLGEIRFAAGDRDGALNAIDHAIELEPRSEYYARQRERFAEP